MGLRARHAVVDENKAQHFSPPLVAASQPTRRVCRRRLLLKRLVSASGYSSNRRLVIGPAPFGSGPAVSSLFQRTACADAVRFSVAGPHVTGRRGHVTAVVAIAVIAVVAAVSERSAKTKPATKASEAAKATVIKTPTEIAEMPPAVESRKMSAAAKAGAVRRCRCAHRC